MIFCDIDGTCANLTHRLPYIQGAPKNWTKFFDPVEVMLDTPIDGTRRLLWGLQKSQQINYMSGRPEKLRATTKEWLILNKFPVNACGLYMRRDGDYRADYIIKEELLFQICGPGLEHKPEFVIDDRPQVCDMWRRHGIPVVQLPWHEEKKMLKNRGVLALMVGPSGGGKTTRVRNRYDNTASIVLSSDDLRESMFGDRADQTHNAEVFETLHALASAHLAAADYVIIDATHLRRKDRLDAVALAQGGPVNYVVVDRPNKKPWHGNMGVVRKHEQMFASQLKDILAGDNLPNVTVFDERVF